MVRLILNWCSVALSLERLSSITKATYLFVQQLISLKLLDLDNDEYEKVPHRYRTRVDADAAALELLCLSCDDEIGNLIMRLRLRGDRVRHRLRVFLEAEKLCTKCAEKFSQESLSIKLLAVQMPLIITSLEVTSSTRNPSRTLVL